MTKVVAALTFCGAALVGCSKSDDPEPCAGAACGTWVMEDYESGTWAWAPWSTPVASAAGGTVGSACAHDGARGMSDPDWYYRTDVGIGLPGDEIQQWVKPSATTGRSYLGFGTTSSGTWAFVAGTNTSELIIMRVEYGTASASYTNIVTVSQTFTAGSWYLMRITFGAAGLVTGHLYAADGVTLLNTISTTPAGFAPGGVAIRSFSGWCSDTLVSTL